MKKVFSTLLTLGCLSLGGYSQQSSAALALASTGPGATLLYIAAAGTGIVGVGNFTFFASNNTEFAVTTSLPLIGGALLLLDDPEPMQDAITTQLMKDFNFLDSYTASDISQRVQVKLGNSTRTANGSALVSFSDYEIEEVIAPTELNDEQAETITRLLSRAENISIYDIESQLSH